ncbi:hypothetical protein NL676_039450 [Syzygium grande]|nr:hypothetical protein NL676_039450 [Syzygium grande]
MNSAVRRVHPQAGFSPTVGASGGSLPERSAQSGCVLYFNVTAPRRRKTAPDSSRIFFCGGRRRVGLCRLSTRKILRSGIPCSSSFEAPLHQSRDENKRIHSFRRSHRRSAFLTDLTDLTDLSTCSSIKGWESEKVDNGHEAALVKTVVRRVSELKRHFQLIVPRAPIKLHSDSLKPLRRRILSWQKVKLLGRGAFARVYEGITDDVFFFAIKEVSLLESGWRGEARLQLQQEICLLSQFDHENIVRCLGSDKDDKKLYLFLELMPKGSLATLYRKYKLRDSHVSEFTRQIVNALKYLHDQKVVHRDIKCANILVDASGSVKLADFGMAEAIKMSAAQTVKGTAFWMAPEIINPRLRSSQSNGSYGLEVDIWSLGCTVLEMLTRRPPYSHLEGMQAVFRIAQGELPRVPKSLSREARDFILTCLRENPKDRPSAAQLLDHPFLRKPPATSGFASPCSPRPCHFRSSL